MFVKKLVLTLAACSLTANAVPALAQERPAAPPAAQSAAAPNAPPAGPRVRRLGERQIAIIGAALAGLAAFTAAVASSGSSRPRPASP